MFHVMDCSDLRAIVCLVTLTEAQRTVCFLYLLVGEVMKHWSYLMTLNVGQAVIIIYRKECIFVVFLTCMFVVQLD